MFLSKFSTRGEEFLNGILTLESPICFPRIIKLILSSGRFNCAEDELLAGFRCPKKEEKFGRAIEEVIDLNDHLICIWPHAH